jgi:cell division septum initiation protein DivIVA
VTTDSWKPFGIPDGAYGPAGRRNGVRVLNLTLRNPENSGKDRAGVWLRNAMIALAVLAAAAAVVSFQAQYRMVLTAKHTAPVAALEAGIPDVSALVFAALGIALALHGKRAVRARLLNVGAVATSVAMNALAAGPGWRDAAIWVMPSVAYALASDTAIGVVRAYTLARQRALSEDLAGDEASPLALLGGVLLWLLRLVMAPPSTLSGLRRWVLDDIPVAPGRAPAAVTAAGEQADRAIAAAENTAAGQVAAAEQDRDQAVAAALHARRTAEQEAATARESARTARGEMDRARETAERQLARAEAAAARQQDEHAAEIARLQEAIGTLDRARADAARGRDELRAALETRTPGAAPRTGCNARREGTKTARFLALVAERHGPLAGLRLEDVSKIAAEVAAEVDLHPGSARAALRAQVLQAQQAGGAS